MTQESVLSKVTVLSQLDPVELEALTVKLRRRTFQRGEVIFHQGDPGDRLHFVVEGQVKIAIMSEDGRENNIALISRGDCFGEMSVLDGGFRSATAVALELTDTLTLSREDFLEFLSQHTQVAIQIISLLTRRLRAMDEMVGDMVFLDVPTRVGKKLLELARTHRDSHGPSARPTILLGQEELSGLVGSTRETVTRALTTYRKLGLLTTSHRRITITNPKGLERIVSQGDMFVA